MPSIKEIYNSIGEVELNADSINLNVDGLEALASTQQADIALIKSDVDDIRADLANGVTINQPVAVTDNGGSLTVDGTVTANVSGTVVDDAGFDGNTSLFVAGGRDQANEIIKAIPLTSGGGGVLAEVSGTVTAILGLSPQYDDGSDSLRVGLNAVSGQDPAAWLQTNGGNVPISGAVTAEQATAANLNATVVQSTATNLRTQAESYQGGTAVGSGNPLQVTLANTGANTTALRVEPKNGAVTRTTGDTDTANTSKEALASSSSRRYLLIQNISDTDMYFNFGATATTDNMLIPKNGGGIVFESGYVPTDAVNVICSGADKKYFILSA